MGSIRVNDGTILLPGLTFRGAATTGLASLAANTMSVVVNGAAVARFTGTLMLIGDTSNANMTTGLTINQGANDNHILTLKSSDIATGLTTILTPDTETDDFFTISKYDADLGGAHMQCLGENSTNNRTVSIHGIGGTAATAKTQAGGVGLIFLYASQHDGSNALSNVAADGNIFSVWCRVAGADSARFVVDEDGDLFAVTTTITALTDTYDDVGLIRAYETARAISGAKGYVRSEWDRFVRYNEDALVEVGILGATIAEGGLWNVTQHLRVMNGAVWQLWTDIMEVAKALPETARQRLPERIQQRLTA